MNGDSYFENASGERQVAVYKRLCRNVSGAQPDSLKNVLDSQKHMEVKRFIKTAVDKDMSDEDIIRTIITRYKLTPVGAKTSTKPKKINFNSTNIKTNIVNILSPRDKEGMITSGISWALNHVENIMNISGTNMTRGRKLDKGIEEFMAKHPEIDNSDRMTIEFLASIGVVKNQGGNRYKLTNRWYREIQ